MLGALKDLLLPQSCSLCGRGDRPLCASCRGRWNAPPRLCSQSVTPVFATHLYDSEAARVIAGAKDHRRRWLLPLIVDGITSATRPLLQSPTLLVPIPSRSLAVRMRGEAMMDVVSRVVAHRLRDEGFDVVADSLLRHSRAVSDQSRLSARQRSENMQGAFLISRRAASDRRIIVVDDVITTGASMREAWRALSSHDIAGGACATSTSFASTRGSSQFL